MPSVNHVPLAWRNLVHDKRRCVVCVAGVACAVVLLFMELGFWNAMLDASVQMIGRLNADVVLVSKGRYYLALRERFTVTRLEQARAVPGVAAAEPLYLETHGILWHDPQGSVTRFQAGEPSARPIRVIAFNPDYPALRDPEIQSQLSLLRLRGNVLVDRRSKPSFGPIGPGLERELAHQQIHIVGTFALGTDFTCDGSLIMSDQTYADLMADQGLPTPALRLADIGLIQLHPGFSPEQVRDQLNALLPSDVRALTLAEVSAQERLFWQLSTPVGLVFSLGLAMGFCVGAVICFQVLSSDVADHLKEYATLKAIGYHARYLNRVVLAEALWLTVLAYGPALLMTVGLYDVLGRLTGLPLYLNLARCALVLILTASMCMLSGLLALSKLRSADPAEVF
jgi:putative ABC transport system permease protein